ncbi:PREDICTED: PITH domain-containing protein CG6153 [Papilio xuthus]|uniref:PITH domain-containing protein CG6153 n=1 Tax=Papilio xuthus TaxID=66420 RepID=A0A194PRQ6_PAPXU|nr:PREDICTED: PITH domain-containing protein CG6153 [Papilio xuthus]KPI93820.1 PITH domain-containing protein CG6153 [Papilio xuthus]
MPHSHCNHGSHDHDHGNPDEIGLQYNLYQKIDKDNVQCLNESVDGSGKTVFKPWEKRLDTSECVESDADEELLFNIPFTGNVKLKGIIIRSEDSDLHPSKLRLFKNKPNMTFDDASMEPDQVFELQKDSQGLLEYTPKIVTFSSVSHLTMHFPTNFGAETTKIYYIGLKGEWTQGHKHGVTICTYESRPMLDDHKLKQFDSVGRPIE